MSAKPSSNLEKLLGALANSQVHERNLVKEAEQSFLDYSLSVITSRALPDLKDGLKPVHRRILYSAYEEKMFNDSRFRKSATLVGSVMGGYHPHGDSSIYMALVRMAQDFSMRYPLLEGQGNFGSIDGDAPAAMRYTEVKMSKLGEKFLDGIKEDAVDFVPNYDGSKEEPVILPIVAPSILLNGGEGIAVGMASKIPPHNLQEVCELAIALLDDTSLPVEKMFEIMKGPDFPTGGLVLGYKGIQKYLLTGKGSFRIRARAQLDWEKNQIIFTEIPFGVKKSSIIKKIARLASDEKNPNYLVIPLLQRFIRNIRDESNLKEGIRLVIECGKEAPLDTILNNLYKYTSLQHSFSSNITLLSKGEPKTLGIIPILREYLEYQLEILVRRTQFNLEKLRARIHLLEGRKTIVTDLKTAIDIITQEDEPEKLIKDKYSLSDIQVKDIFDLPIRQLKRIEFQKLIDELEEKVGFRIAHEERLASKELQHQEIKKQLMDIMQEYVDDPRRTDIDQTKGYSLSQLDLIPKETLVINVSEKNYISALPLKGIKLSNRGTKGFDLSNDQSRDFVSDLLIASSHDDIFLFTNFGKVYKVKGYDIKVSNSNKWTNKPLAIKNILGYKDSPFKEGEKVIKTIAITPEDYEKDLYLLFATKQGRVKKTRLSDEQRVSKDGKIVIHNNFKTITKKGKQAFKRKLGNKSKKEWPYNEDDELMGVIKITDESEIFLTSPDARVTRFNAKDIKPRSRGSGGQKGINLFVNKNGEKTYVGDLVSVSSSYEGDKLLMISETGKGKINEFNVFESKRKKSPTSKFTPKRGMVAYGSVKSKTGEKEPVKLVACVAVWGNEEIALMTKKNHLNRFNVSKIPTLKGGNTVGVKLIDLKEDKKDKVIKFAKYVSLNDDLKELKQENTNSVEE
ncbi:DNA gyrase subunit A [Mycoplasma ovis str. Michigan]|uniref:DNA topoisomerase (ATP-hydrolyzing) n=1 Tax=Mycoplasma ovis str. Michigan TaxID=1415773 RepID=A0ABN4BQC2_9MOLU|nr:DNA gyrase subunit A [Mycoplasma ovis]AHC40054.1 DNA gyrase subunit A [Mycoplasma ovis str. Michigan]